MIIGITGGMGCGKTYVSNILRKQGFPVYSCDDRARSLMKDDAEVKAALVELVGADAYTGNGELNKPVIAAFLYANKENREKINALVHPKVRLDFQMWCRLQDADVIFMECAILYESGFDQLVDKVLYVYASDDVRIHRIIHRDKLNRMEVTRRIKTQTPEAVKMRLADFCIINNGNNNILKQLQNIKI